LNFPTVPKATFIVSDELRERARKGLPILSATRKKNPLSVTSKKLSVRKFRWITIIRTIRKTLNEPESLPLGKQRRRSNDAINVPVVSKTTGEAAEAAEDRVGQADKVPVALPDLRGILRSPLTQTCRYGSDDHQFRLSLCSLSVMI
jgi:hypothetical protein